MREITIVARFRCGTTRDDPKMAEAECKQLLLNKLKENHTAGGYGDGELFSVKIQSVKSESLPR